MNGEGTRRVDRSGLLTSLVRFLSCPPLFTSHNPLPWLIPSFLSHSPRSGREVEPNGERRRQGAEREEPKDRGAGWMTVGTTTSASLSVPLLALGSLHSPSAPIRERRGTLRPAPYAHRFSAPCPRPSPRGGTGPRPLPSVVWLPLRSLHSLRVRRLPSVATAARRNE